MNINNGLNQVFSTKNSVNFTIHVKYINVYFFGNTSKQIFELKDFFIKDKLRVEKTNFLAV